MTLEGYSDNDADSYKGNDIDSDGDGKVDAAVDSDKFAGLAPSDGNANEVLKTDGTSTLSWIAQSSGGITYVQSSAPSSPSSGESWFDTDGGIYRVYADLGSGADWHPVPPTQVLEEAVTFAESDVTVMDNQTKVIGGSISLFEGDGTSVQTTAGSDDSSASNDEGWGVIISPNVDLEDLTVHVSSNTGSFAAVQVIRVSDDTELYSNFFGSDLSAGSSQELNLGSDVTLKTTETYYVNAYDGGGTFNHGIDTSPSYNYTSSHLDITGSVKYENVTTSETTSERYCFDAITGHATNVTSGDALVAFDNVPPTDLKSHDLATYQATEDGETVTVDVLDGADNVLFSDIGQNFDISTVDTSKQIKLRANLSRASTSNNPTFDYAAWRGVR